MNLKTSATAAAVVLAAVVAPLPASAATTSTAGMSTHCYQWPHERLAVAWPHGGTFETGPIFVTDGSPCRDINVRSVTSVDGGATCRTMRAVFPNRGVAGPWRRVCTRWAVLVYGAREGDIFVVESTGRPSTVTVRS